MPKKVRAYYLKPRTEALLFYFGVALFPVFCVLSVLVSWQVTVGTFTLLMLVDEAIVVAGIGIVGAVSWLRLHTKAFATDSEIHQLPFEKPIPLAVDAADFPIAPEEAAGVARALGEPVEDVERFATGAQAVAMRRAPPVSLLGYFMDGFHYGGISSLKPGPGGLQLVDGENEGIETQWGTFLPFQTHIVDHSHVPIGVKTTIEALKNPNLKTGEYAVRRTGDVSPGFVKVLRTNLLYQAIVLQSIGYDGMAERAWRRMESEAAKKGSVLDLALEDGGYTAIRKAVTDFLTGYLPKSPDLKIAMDFGWAGLDYWKDRCYRLQAEVNRLTAIASTLKDAEYEHIQNLRNRASEESRAYAPRPPPSPVDDEVRRRRQGPGPDE